MSTPILNKIPRDKLKHAGNITLQFYRIGVVGLMAKACSFNVFHKGQFIAVLCC